MQNEIITQTPARPLIKSKEELADNLQRYASILEANKLLRVYDPELFKIFHETFMNLKALTSHTKTMQTRVIKGHNLLKLIAFYFRNSPEKNIRVGVELAREYHRALLDAGILTTEGR